MFARCLASLWSRLFARPASKERPPRARPPQPRTLPIRTRQELEMAWLLRFLPFQMQQALWLDLHNLLRRCPPVEKLPVEDYSPLGHHLSAEQVQATFRQKLLAAR